MSIFIYPLIIVYIFLLVLGCKSTWEFVSGLVLEGSSGILLPILVFILLFLIIGPIMGIINLGKLAIKKLKNNQ
jgi:hypothetical protein